MKINKDASVMNANGDVVVSATDSVFGNISFVITPAKGNTIPAENREEFCSYVYEFLKFCENAEVLSDVLSSIDKSSSKMKKSKKYVKKMLSRTTTSE